MGLRNLVNVASLIRVGKAQLEAIPGEDGPEYLCVSFSHFSQISLSNGTRLVLVSESTKINVTLHLPVFGGKQ